MSDQFIGPHGALVARYLGPTNCKPGRIVVHTTGKRRAVIPWMHKLSIDENYAYAANAACVKLSIEFKHLVQGILPKSANYSRVFVIVK